MQQSIDAGTEFAVVPLMTRFHSGDIPFTTTLSFLISQKVFYPYSGYASKVVLIKKVNQTPMRYPIDCFLESKLIS